MAKYVTEFLGTFFLVLTIGLTVLAQSPFAPIAIGCVLIAMVYMGGHVSGANYNPAVSLAAVMAGALPTSQFVPYVVAQLAGATVAAGVVRMIVGDSFAPAPSPDAPMMAALLVEVLFTFALALVVLNVAVSKRTTGNSYYGLAIGLTVLAGAFAGGGISGGAFNPAVGFGPILVHAMTGGGTLADLWLYFVGPLLGAALAAGVYRMQEAASVPAA